MKSCFGTKFQLVAFTGVPSRKQPPTISVVCDHDADADCCCPVSVDRRRVGRHGSREFGSCSSVTAPRQTSSDFVRTPKFKIRGDVSVVSTAFQLGGGD